MLKNSLDVFEHDTILVAGSTEDLFNDYGERAKITELEFRALQRFHSTVSDDLFSLGHRRIKLKHYVGLLRVGNLNINILPKVDRNSEEKKKWHSVLIEMIRYTQNFRSKRSSQAFLKTNNLSILDLYIAEFFSEVEEVLRKGARKNYSSKEENINLVKGKILFSKNIQKNNADQSKVYCHFQVYTFDTHLNHILEKALEKGLAMTNNEHILSMGKKLKELIPETSPRPVTGKVFERIVFNRNNQYYEKAIKLAKILLLDTGPVLEGGRENVVSFLFDMNQLFEEFVFKVTKKAFADDEYEVHRNGKEFWDSKRIRPDIVVENKKDKTSVVFDTKWKIPADKKPGDQDLKQIFVYNHYYNAKISYLLYPKENGEPFTPAKDIIKRQYKEYLQNGENIDKRCYLGFISIIKDQKLDIETLKKTLRKCYDEAEL